MNTPHSKREFERAAIWLRLRGWGRAQAAPPAAEPAPEPPPEQEEIDIAGWPALVAPFYDERR
ncbi:MAG TPA: hypothetical protein VFS95_07425 [Telluria sp.]|nr:hypothetical protein [Telluria sp.]